LFFCTNTKATFSNLLAAATNENLTGENWELILAVTDKIARASPEM
jgi:signal transducing adaptor molecule